MSPTKFAGLAVILLLTAVSSGCDYCIEPLSDWCGGSECPTYEDLMVEDCDADADYLCGYAVLGQPVGWTVEAYYFNGQGELVAVHAYSDINEFCGGRTHEVWYGRKITCEREMDVGDPPCGD